MSVHNRFGKEPFFLGNFSQRGQGFGNEGTKARLISPLRFASWGGSVIGKGVGSVRGSSMEIESTLY